MAPAHTIHLFAAGSLKAALSDVAKAYEVSSGQKVESRFGPSGTLKSEIAGGAKADIFASANMEHPRALHDAGLSGPAMLFTRNKLCALVRPGLNIDSASLLAAMLDPNIKLATSTPKADPSGDYAFEVFAKAEALQPGTRAKLEAKALKLTGTRDSATPPDGVNVYGWHVAEGRADIFLTYCTNAMAARMQYTGQRDVALPEALAVGAGYGMTVMNGAGDAARAFAAFVMSVQGQTILARYGFAEVG
jgi:ABC-type molybdate transport system substrate-binding protein